MVCDVRGLGMGEAGRDVIPPLNMVYICIVPCGIRTVLASDVYND